MAADSELKRFVDAQQRDYEVALAEIKNGRKRGHWMWYVFPQIRGLGFSSTSQHYAIHDLNEAQSYLRHPILGQRLVEICKALLELDGSNAHLVFGSPDDLKLKSSMTLFAAVPGSDLVFQQVLEKYYQGKMDIPTLTLLDRYLSLP
ncbi:MAG TPA: DUF1810 domain-containing protein [Mucilaginibacter sp.]|nr:DUF1810 domain-containing protein [Mucilaginibacter sp.]